MKKISLFLVGLCMIASSFAQTSTFTDARDNQVYTKITIGTQIWMAENLNYETDESWCYTNDTSDCAFYGRLYHWDQADTICPSGWHLPTDEEWKTLESYLGMSSAQVDLPGYRSSGDVGYDLKTTIGWSSNGGGSDNYYFSALSGGFRQPGGNYRSQGFNALFWTATDELSQAYGRMLFYQKGIERNLYTKLYGASVRCVKD